MPSRRHWYWAFGIAIVGFVLLGMGFYFWDSLTVRSAVATFGIGGGLVLVAGRWMLVQVLLRYRHIRVPDWVALAAVLVLGAVLYFVLNR